MVALLAAIGTRQDADQRALEWILVLLTTGVTLIAGGRRRLLHRSPRRAMTRDERERRCRETQAEFAATMQFVHDEPEAHDLVCRHLERPVVDSTVVVLNRNDSANRLEPATPVAADSHLAMALADGVEPRACVAARLGRTHEGDAADSARLSCDLCGKGVNSTCTPLLVSGEMIGSILVQHPARLDATDRERVTETVTLASPVIGNLRNLAIAELHAATDSLTGLPDRRALEDTLRRMVAQAGRSATPLAAASLDLDHFTRITGSFGVAALPMHALDARTLLRKRPCAVCGQAAGSRPRPGGNGARRRSHPRHRRSHQRLTVDPSRPSGRPGRVARRA